MPGIFISRGMTVSIPQFSIRIREDGELENDPIVLHVRFDVCPTWVDVSLRHLDAALQARQHRDAVWSGTDNDAKSAALEREFEASMQAIMAAAIAIDAFYAILQTHVELPPSLVKRWRERRTSRFAQVSEVLRRSFRLNPKGAGALRENIKEIYRVRDLAVHPSGRIDAAMHHPELDVGVEWRFAYFRASNAEKIVYGASWILWDLCKDGKAIPGVAEYARTLLEKLMLLFPQGHPWTTTVVPPS